MRYLLFALTLLFSTSVFANDYGSGSLDSSPYEPVPQRRSAYQQTQDFEQRENLNQINRNLQELQRTISNQNNRTNVNLGR